MHSTPRVEFPDPPSLIADLHELATHVDSIDRYLAASSSGSFTHPDGRRDPLEGVALSTEQASVLAYLAQRCPTPISMETGFGMGTSASIILGARQFVGDDFEHLAFDPYGLPDRRGSVVQSYLETEYKDKFKHCRERSETGLAELLSKRGPASVGLAMIDGGHHFETVLCDFRFADLLCCVGGFIVFDDAWYPAIETVVNYVRHNRTDYAVTLTAAPNTAVLQKVDLDRRPWNSFVPFPVPARENWTSGR